MGFALLGGCVFAFKVLWGSFCRALCARKVYREAWLDTRFARFREAICRLDSGYLTLERA